MSTPLQPPTFGREQSNASIPVEDDKKEDLYTTPAAHVTTVDSALRKEIDQMHIHRKLTTRQMSLAAMGGSVGAALFIGIGGALHVAGPIGLLIGAIIWTIVVFSAGQTQIETVTHYPADASTIRNAHRFVDPSVGVAAGWNYFLQQAFYICYEAVAVASLMNYWIRDLNSGVFVTVSLLIFLGINIWRADLFGEAEFWVAICKFVLATALLFYTICVMAGANPLNDAFGFRHWQYAQVVGETAGWRFGNVLSGLLICTGCIGGPEYISMVAGEVQNPRKVMPKSFNTIVYRLLFFFMSGAFCVGILIPYDDPAISGGADGEYISASPYIASMLNLKISVLPDIFNALVITSIISAGNAYTFGASRALHGMALDGSAPKIFKLRNRHGTPWTCVLAALTIGLISYLSVDSGTSQVLTWILAVAAGTACVNQSVMSLTWIRLNKAIHVQGHTRKSFLRHTTKYQPYAAWINLVGSLCIMIGGPWAVFDGFVPKSALTLFFSYGIVVIDIFIFLIYKFVTTASWYKGSSVPGRFRRAHEVDLVGNMEALDIYEEEFEIQREARGFTKMDKFLDKVFVRFFYGDAPQENRD